MKQNQEIIRRHTASRWHMRTGSRRAAFLGILLSGLAIIMAPAQVPDLTNGGVPGDTESFNVGPTGFRGWAYHEETSTSKSRQLLVKTVAPGSPAASLLSVNDVILGADGSGASPDPSPFSWDARRSIADAINAAEARSPATLKLLRWRAGVTDTVTLTLETMGAYSATAPYHCPKSRNILAKCIPYVAASGDDGFNGLQILVLLAANDPANPNNAAHQAQARAWAHQWIATPSEINQLKLGNVEGSKMAWNYSYRLIVLAEYYLQTRDAAIYPTLEAMAICFARNQSAYGTTSHGFASKNPDGSDNRVITGYGAINASGVAGFLGLVLAREAGVTNEFVNGGISRSERFFASYSGKGSIPYGEHPPSLKTYDMNGKNATAALAFSLMPNRTEEARFFAKMTTLSHRDREKGHAGPYFAYVWSPLGSAVIGEEAAAYYFSKCRWLYDLARRWDGDIDFDHLGIGSGNKYAGFSDAMTVLTTYALPLRQLHITGRNHPASLHISTNEMDEAIASDNFNAGASDTNALLAALSDWSPLVRDKAATEFGNRPQDAAALLGTLHAMAADTSASPGSRHAACTTLGTVADRSSTWLLAQLLTDNESYVRFGAAAAMRGMPNRNSYLSAVLKAAASTAKPCFPFDDDDPVQVAHAELAQLLFYQGAVSIPGILNSSIAGVDRGLLMPAVRAISRTPMGGARSSLAVVFPQLTFDEFLELSNDIFTCVRFISPADGMFAENAITVGNDLFRKFNIAEGVPLARDIFSDCIHDGLEELAAYAGACLTVEPDPEILHHLNYYSVVAGEGRANSARTAILNDTNPITLTPLKRIDSIIADDPIFALPKKSTMLHVQATNYVLRAPGDSSYAWRKASGPGEVLFGSSGTPQSKDTTIFFKDGTPGVYSLEVTMTDTIGYTLVRESIQVTLLDASGNLPTNTAPAAASQSLTVTRPGVPYPVRLAGSDPEGDSLAYRVVTQPLHGEISGEVPFLRYTAPFGYTGGDTFSFEVTDAQGLASTGTVSVTVSPGIMGLAVYEPFDYPVGYLNGLSGASEIGLTGTWLVANGDNFNVGADSYSYTQLPSKGNKLYRGTSGASATRTLNASALASAGLLDHGGELWCGAYIGITADVNRTNSGLSFGLKDGVGSSGAKAWLSLNASVNGLNARACLMNTFGSGVGASGDYMNVWPNEQSIMLLVRCNWGATAADPDTVRTYRMLNKDGRVFLYETPLSTVSMVMDQSKLNSLFFAFGSWFYVDEFRVGPTLESVVSGTVAATADVTPPGPGPLAIASAIPGGGSPSAILTAVPVYDERGVEYAFTCTSGNGHDSGWQESHVYQDTGLTPGGTYTYTVMARDRSPARNQTNPSAPAQLTLPATATVPALAGLPQSHSGQILSLLGLTAGTVTTVHTGTVADGIVHSQALSAGTQVTFGTAVDLVAEYNQTPTADSQWVTTTEDTAKAVTLAGSDADGDPVTYSIVTQPAHGTLGGTVPNLTYTPAANYNGSDAFTFKVTGGALESAPATVSITVTAVSDAPVAYPQSVTTAEDRATAITLTGSDADGNPLTYVIVTQPVLGTLSGTAPNLTYTPFINHSGADSFTYTVSDGTTVSEAAEVSLTIIPAPASGPLSRDRIVGVTQDTQTTALGYYPEANASYIGGSGSSGSRTDTNIVLGYGLPTLPQGSVVTGAVLRFEVTGARAVATRNLHVYLLDTANPDASHTSFYYQGPSNTTASAKYVGQQFINYGGSSTTTFADDLYDVTLPLTGDALALLQGYYSGGPVPNRVEAFFRFNMDVANSTTGLLGYYIDLAQDESSLEILYSMHVDHAPVANGQDVTTAENTPVPITLTGSDANGDALTYAVVTQPAHGTLSGTAPNLTYTPEANYTGSDVFTFKANDGTADSTAATVSLTVTAASVPPVVNAGPDQAVSLTGSTPWTPANLTCSAWYDAADTSTITASLGTVSQWRDKSGNDRHANQPTAANPPATGASINGRNVLTFSSDSLTVPYSADLQKANMGIFVVCKATGGTGAYRCPLIARGPGAEGYTFYASNVNDWQAWGGNGSAWQVLNGTAVTLNSTVMLNMTMNSGTITLHQAGVLKETLTGHIPSPSAALTIGAAGTNYYMAGDIAEIVYVGHTPSTEDRQKMEGYLVHKWGMTASLAANHPYKTAAPQAPSATANLDGTVGDANGDPLTTVWTLVSGPAGISVGSTSAVDTTANFIVAGTYTLRLTANDGSGPVSDDVVITVTPPGSYAVLYNGNGHTSGSTPVDAGSYASGATVTVPGNTGSLARTGSTFAGWNTQANGGGTTYAAGSTFAMGAAHVTLYAKWTAMSAFESWIAEGGVGPGADGTFAGDANGDGMANGLVWLLGGDNPIQDPSALLPQAAQNGGDLSLSFKMLNSTKRGAAVLSLQYSRDLGVSDPWTNHTIQVPDTTGPAGGVDFVISPLAGTDCNQVQVMIPASAAGGTGRLFVRLGGILSP